MGGISSASSGMLPPLYRPIDSSKYEIRLLQIPFSMLRNLGQADPEPLTAKLVHHTLPTAATSLSQQFVKALTRKHYTALSYVWGDPTPTEKIIVDGHSVPITYALYSALRQLQCDAFGEETVWVDALCINQADDTEKSAQIRNMREVYHNAGNVRVWLGSANGQNDQIYETMQYIQTLTDGFLPDKYAEGVEWWETNLLPYALRPIGLTAQTTLSGWHKINMFKETFKTPEVRGKSTLQGLVKTDERKFFEDYLKFRPKEKHLKKFLDVVPDGDLKRVVDAIEKYLIVDPEWFNRIWVVQEVGVAWEDVEICRGPYNISWDGLLNTIFYLHFTCHAHFPSIDKVIGLELIRLGFREGKRRHLRDLMHECRFRKASNPRDKVYGLYGLMNDQVNLFLKPDYKKTVEEVFSHTTLHFIHQSKSLDPICRQQKLHRRVTLPTWVPDFELDFCDTADSLLPLNLTERLFHAAGHDMRAQYKLSMTETELFQYTSLFVSGIRIGRITKASDMAQTDDIASIEKNWGAVMADHFSSTKDKSEDLGVPQTSLDFVRSRFEEYASYQNPTLTHREAGLSDNNLTIDAKVSDSSSTISSTTTIVPPRPEHSLITSYINVLLTGRINSITRASDPILPSLPLEPTPSSSRSTAATLSDLPMAYSSRSTLSLHLDTTLHKAFGSSKAPSKSATTLAQSSANASTSSFFKPEDRARAPRNKIVSSLKDHQDFAEAMSHLESSMRRKRFFVTENGNLGSAGESVQEGDQVFVLYGCSVPVVLRNCPVTGSENGKWNFVSEAFVDGFMDGEAIAWMLSGRLERGIEYMVLV